MGSSWIRDRTQVSCVGGQILYRWVTREAPGQFLIKFNVHFSYDHFLDKNIRNIKTCVHTKICTWIYIATSFSVAKSWNQSKYQLTNEPKNRLQYFVTVENFLAAKKMNYWYMKQHGEAQKHYAKWKKPDVEDYMLSDSMYMKFLKKQSCSNRNQISHCLGLEMVKWGCLHRGWALSERSKCSVSWLWWWLCNSVY